VISHRYDGMGYKVNSGRGKCDRVLSSEVARIRVGAT